MSAALLAIDLGTTAAKSSLYGLDGSLIAGASQRYEPVRPREGWCEQHPDVWWRAVCAAVRQCLCAARGARVACVGVSGVMNGAVLIDDAGRPVRPALLHADLRAREQARRLAGQMGVQCVRALTGHRPEPFYTAAKLAWLCDEEPRTVARARWCIQAKDYVRGRLTGVWGLTDPSDASLTGMFDLRRGCWSSDIADALAIDVRLLPAVAPCASVGGVVTGEAASATSIAAGVPVAIGAGDGACATVGAGAVGPGDTYHYLGGTSWIGSVMASYSPGASPDLSVFEGAAPGAFVLYGTVQSAGSCIEWLMRLAGVAGALDGDFAALEALAAQAPAGARGLLFLPYLEGERAPIWDSAARGAFVGLTALHGRAELARAVHEGVALALGSVLGRMRAAGADPAVVRLLGGGARSALWRSILAAVYARPVAVLERLAEATGGGAAVIAGIAAGVLPGWEAARLFAPVASVEEPDPALTHAYAALAPVYEGLHPALAGTTEALRTLEQGALQDGQGQ